MTVSMAWYKHILELGSLDPGTSTSVSHAVESHSRDLTARCYCFKEGIVRHKEALRHPKFRESKYPEREDNGRLWTIVRDSTVTKPGCSGAFGLFYLAALTSM